MLKYSRTSQILSILPEIIKPFNDRGVRENEYLSEVLLYTGAVIPKDKRGEFLEIIKGAHKNGESLMKTVADSFREEGIQIGLEKGEKIGFEKGVKMGEEKGEEKGEKKGRLDDKIEIDRKMLKKGMSVELIMELTDLTSEQIREQP